MLLGGCITTREEGQQLRSDLRRLESDLDLLARTHFEARAELEQKVSQAEEKSRRLEGELTEVRHQVAKKDAAIAHLQEEIEDLRLRLRDAKTQLGRTRRTLHDILLGRSPEMIADAGNEPVEIAGKRVPDNVAQHFEFAEGLLSDGRLTEAVAAFALLLQRHPEAELAGHALYGIGEAHSRRASKAESEETRDDALRQAIRHFQRLLADYPKSEKADRALFKMGLAFESMGEKEDAHMFYQELVSAYPDSALVVEARKRLK